MKSKVKYIIIAKDGFPLELYIGKPITNFIRKLIHASHKECEDCYRKKESQWK